MRVRSTIGCLAVETMSGLAQNLKWMQHLPYLTILKVGQSELDLTKSELPLRSNLVTMRLTRIELQKMNILRTEL
jgi:hypothetical protein